MIVLDCNAALSIAFGTPEGEGLAALMLEGERSIAPSLFHAELASALSSYVRAGRLGREDAIAVGEACIALVDQFVGDEHLWREALAASEACGHSSYDMFYMVLARRNAATLFTLDRKLQKVCIEAKVDCIGFEVEP